MRPDIVVTNDDGIDAPALDALVEALSEHGRVWVVAPDRERSGASQALSLDAILRVEEVAPRRFKTSGTPIDCVYFALLELVPEARLVVSGINRGANLADDVNYSGTVAAALEAARRGLPALAVSVAGRRGPWGPAAQLSADLAGAMLLHGMPERTILNVNLPKQPSEELGAPQLTRLGRQLREQRLEQRKDPHGRDYWWIGGGRPVRLELPGTDCFALERGHPSITPLPCMGTPVPPLPWLEAFIRERTPEAS